MSLFSSMILPSLEKGLIALEPEFKIFLLSQAKAALPDLLAWIESKHAEESQAQTGVSHG